LYLALAMLVSYARARGESLGVELSGVGLMERAERLIALLLVSFIVGYDFIVAFYFFVALTALTAFTVLQRFVYLWKNL
ncbi:MAG: CDP-alcohol phosphatidyltransferase family protein, partial [Desulfurococcaceae archaeon]